MHCASNLYNNLECIPFREDSLQIRAGDINIYKATKALKGCRGQNQTLGPNTKPSNNKSEDLNVNKSTRTNQEHQKKSKWDSDPAGREITNLTVKNP